MLKRTISLLLILLIAFGWCACGVALPLRQASARIHTESAAAACTCAICARNSVAVSCGAVSVSYANSVRQTMTDMAVQGRKSASRGYTNSPLVSFTQISPNRTSPRNHTIDTITIHAVQGNESTVESLGAVFANPERRASCNYAIGYDGKIALICPESDRSWCSSSRENDNRAITIEVSTHAVPDYEVYPAAYEALVDLLVDICLRDGIRELLFKNDKSLVGHPELQNVTVHRWFADTDCPGKDLMEKIPGIVDRVNARLDLKGDYNCDSTLNIEDVTVMLNKLTNGIPLTDGDFNSDSCFTISDVTTMVNYLAG